MAAVEAPTTVAPYPIDLTVVRTLLHCWRCGSPKPLDKCDDAEAQKIADRCGWPRWYTPVGGVR